MSGQRTHHKCPLRSGPAADLWRPLLTLGWVWRYNRIACFRWSVGSTTTSSAVIPRRTTLVLSWPTLRVAVGVRRRTRSRVAGSVSAVQPVEVDELDIGAVCALLL